MDQSKEQSAETAPAAPKQAPGFGVSPAMERERAHWQQVAPHLRRGRKQPRGGFKGPDGRIR